jgi:predicted dehydrogenase
MARRRIAVIGAGMAIPSHADSLLELGERVDVAGVFSRERDELDRERLARDQPVAITH